MSWQEILYWQGTVKVVLNQGTPLTCALTTAATLKMSQEWDTQISLASTI